VLVLVYEYGLVLKEIATILELPIGTVASHLARGKAAVAAHLELIPEFERSIRNEISGTKDRPQIVFGEVVDE
jgi:hypothetical protein